ncbi:MAG: hydroxymethylbilane synthase [Bacteroidota bacterium]
MENTTKTWIIGTRGSRLALWQANYTRDLLKEAGIESELKIIKTKGDKIQHLSFDKIEGKGFFTKEIEDALLRGDIDLAVHSMKDLPTESPEGLSITAVSYREDPADWLVVHKAAYEATQSLRMKANPIVGTSSARRKAQIKHLRPDVQLKDIRGNVPTRLDKLRQGQFDAILLAAAGLRRLEMDLEEFEVVRLNPREFVPAPAQGVLAYQVRQNDKTLRRLLKVLHHKEVAQQTNIERKVLQLLGGGCHTPLGVYCNCDQGGNYHVWAATASSTEGPLKSVQLSSSTSFGLAEKIVEGLTT